MAEELQGLLEKIQREGVEKAEAQAAAIVAEAQEKASSLIKEALKRAQELEQKAQEEAQASSERAQVTIQQAARDTLLSVQDAITSMLTQVLTQNVQTALAEPQTLTKLAADAVTALVGDNEAQVAAASTDLVAALQATFAQNAANKVTVVLDEQIGSGFTVLLDGGRVEHDFTGKVLADALAKRLRPELAKLVTSER